MSPVSSAPSAAPVLGHWDALARFPAELLSEPLEPGTDADALEMAVQSVITELYVEEQLLREASSTLSPSSRLGALTRVQERIHAAWSELADVRRPLLEVTDGAELPPLLEEPTYLHEPA